MITDKNTQHSLPLWTEIEYSQLCKSPYLATPVFLPKDVSYYLCKEDGTRKPSKLIFVVFKSVHASKDAEWEDDPMIGEIYVNILGDDDEEIEPVRAINIGVEPSELITMVREDENVIVFKIKWLYGKVEIPKAEKTDEGYVIKKDDFGEEGVLCTMKPRTGENFDIRLKIPYIGFMLQDENEQSVMGEIEIAHDDLSKYTYSFVGNDDNDRFSISLDDNKLNYLCVLRTDGTLVVRDMRERLATVKEIPSEGKLSDLLMGAHSALVKNKSNRWRISLKGKSFDEADDLELNPVALSRFAFKQFEKASDDQLPELATQLIHLEQTLAFQWFWLKEDDWSHEHLADLLNIEGSDNEQEAMMRQALLFNRFEQFMKQLIALSFVTQKPIQGDQLQARNNKRKIARCAKAIKAHQAGETSLWDMDDEQRKEILQLFGTFHREFTEALES